MFPHITESGFGRGIDSLLKAGVWVFLVLLLCPLAIGVWNHDAPDEGARLLSMLTVILPVGVFALSFLLRRHSLASRLLMGIAVGWMVTFLGLMVTTHDLTYAEMEQYNGGPSGPSSHGETRSVGGFPIPNVQLGRGGSFPEYIPWSKGLSSHLLNLVLNSLVGCLLTFRVPRASHSQLCVPVASLGVLLMMPAWVWYLHHVD